MKKIVILVIMLSGFSLLSPQLLSQLSAQTKKVDLDSLSCAIKYRGIPERPLNPIVANYFCLLKCSSGMQNEIGTTRIMDAMEIEGLEKVYNSADADIYYQIDMSDLHIVSERTLERKSEHKDKDGNVIVDYYYWVEMEYTLGVVGSIIKPNDNAVNGGDILFRENLLGAAGNLDATENFGTTENIEIYRSNEFGNRKDADNFWRRNRGSVIHKIVVDHAALAIANANSRVSKKFGFPAVKIDFNLIITNEDKHLENEDFRTATQTLKATLEMMTFYQGLRWEAVSREVEYFISVVERYKEPKRKADVCLRHAALHNLFAIYYFLDDVENAEKYARLLMENGYQTSKANADLQLITAMGNDFRRTGITTRHFLIYDFYTMEGHGNNSRYDPRGTIGTYLNNGYYDGYGQGRHDGYRIRYLKNHGGYIPPDNRYNRNHHFCDGNCNHDHGHSSVVHDEHGGHGGHGIDANIDVKNSDSTNKIQTGNR
jgi:hypothetical protein